MVMYPAFIIGVTKVENNRIKNRLSIIFKYIYPKNFPGSSLQLEPTKKTELLVSCTKKILLEIHISQVLCVFICAI
ncbi:MAG: hypothetical protein A2W17_01985 [Planctomycetes bacterium RBG_16_41_13]|nr:MAG: hypothetical protein A2W17_01985 [Planctomycetes bacterium RBG_16_41_13]